MVILVHFIVSVIYFNVKNIFCHLKLENGVQISPVSERFLGNNSENCKHRKISIVKKQITDKNQINMTNKCIVCDDRGNKGWYSVPMNPPELQGKWVAALDLGFFDPKTTRVCYRHFRPEQLLVISATLTRPAPGKNNAQPKSEISQNPMVVEENILFGSSSFVAEFVFYLTL